jgi:hypothetical protein
VPQKCSRCALFVIQICFKNAFNMYLKGQLNAWVFLIFVLLLYNMLQKRFRCALFINQICFKNTFDCAPKMLEICFIHDPDKLQKCFIHVFEKTAKCMFKKRKTLFVLHNMLQTCFRCALFMIQNMLQKCF